MACAAPPKHTTVAALTDLGKQTVSSEHRNSPQACPLEQSLEQATSKDLLALPHVEKVLSLPPELEARAALSHPTPLAQYEPPPPR